nr:VP2 [Epizootic hemorrhagic disease virus]
MEDFDIAIYKRPEILHSSSVFSYPVTIELNQDGECNNIEQMYGKNSHQLFKGKATEVFRIEDNDEYKITIPEALNIGIRRYAERSSGVEVGEKYDHELAAVTTNQRIKPGFDDEHQKVVLDHECGRVMMNAKAAESVWVHLKAKEEKGCNHTREVHAYEAILSDSITICSGTCYDISTLIQVRIIGDISENKFRRRKALGGFVEVGTPQIINRIQQKTQQKILSHSVTPDLFNLKESFFIGNKAGEVDLKPRIREDPNSAEIDVLARRWHGDQSVDIADQVIYHLRQKGRKAYRMIPKNESKIDERVRLKLRSNLADRGEGEVKNLRNTRNETPERKFAAILMMTGCDCVQRALWYDEVYPILSGILSYGLERLGCVYYELKNKFRWSIRKTYADACAGVCDERQTHVARFDYFDLNRETNDSVYKWDISTGLERGGKTTRNKGVEYATYAGDDIDQILVHDFDPQKYNDFMQRIINNGWQEKEGVGQLMKQVGNIDNYEFTKDAYIDSAGFLRLPDYYDHDICSTLYDARFRIARVPIRRQRGEDPWQKITDGDLVTENRSWSVPLDNVIDRRPCFAGKILSARKQSMSERFKEKIKELGRDEGAQKFFRKIKSDEHVCVQGDVIRYSFFTLKRRIFSMLKWYLPKTTLDDILGYEDIEYRTDQFNECFGQESIVYNAATVFQLIYNLIEFGFERRNATTETSRMNRLIIRWTYGGWIERMNILEEELPKYAEALKKSRNSKVLEDLLPMILYQALVLSSPMTSELEKRAHPFFLFCKDMIRVIPVRTQVWERGMPLSRALFVYRFHPGTISRRRAVGEEVESIIKQVYDYWIRIHFEWVGAADRLRTRREIIQAYLGSNCKGVGQLISNVFPIIHPRKGFIVGVYSNNDMDGSNVEYIVAERFNDIKASILGTFCIKIGANQQISVYGGSGVTVKLLEKVFFGHKWKIAHIKLEGKIYENHELITKLMN